MTKKFLFLLLACIMVIGLLPASIAAAEPIELTFCYWGGKAVVDARHKVVELYNASQDKYVVKDIPIDNGSYVAKIQAYFAAGNEPDIIQSSADYGDVYVKDGVLTDLTPYIEQTGLMERWPKALVDAYTYDGKIYAAPFTYNMMNITYNKTLFDKNGVPYPTPDWTEEDFLDAAKKLTYGEGIEKVWGFLQGWSTPTVLANIYGTSIFDYDTMTLHAADNQAFIDGFTFLANLALVEGVSPDAAGEASAGGGFATGKFAMTFSALWDMDSFQKSMTDEIDICRFPLNTTYNVRWGNPVSNIGFYIPATCQNKDGAWDFIYFACTNEEAQKAMAYVSMPANKDLIESEEYLQQFPEGWRSFDKSVAVDFSNAAVWPWTAGVWAKLMSELTTQWEYVMNHEKTPAEAIADFQALGDEVLAKEAKR